MKIFNIKYLILISLILGFLFVGQVSLVEAGVCILNGQCLSGQKTVADCGVANGEWLIQYDNCDNWSAAKATPSQTKNAFQGISERVKNIGTQPGFTGTASLEQTIGGIIKGALILVGTIFLILMVYGGYIWMLARGDEAEAKKAKDIISMAIIGIIVVLAAYAITYFIVYRLTQATGAGLQ